MRWINTQEGATGFIREVKTGLHPRSGGCRWRSSDEGWAGAVGLLELEAPRGDSFREPSALILQGLRSALVLPLALGSASEVPACQSGGQGEG